MTPLKENKKFFFKFNQRGGGNWITFFEIFRPHTQKINSLTTIPKNSKFFKFFQKETKIPWNKIGNNIILRLMQTIYDIINLKWKS